ncbi:MAG: DUF418 domain-containing protein [Planctomycetes bacterium]|nr:DUF418 domain-containing protein [Planctomycetota bacterium]
MTTLSTELTPAIALPTAAPVSETARIRLIDALRGVALLGILLMNIPGFSMPNYFSESFKSNPGDVNFWVSAVISVVFEGKMRALFGMLFGAGVLLFVSQKASAGQSTTWLFIRRMLWLVLFGLFHAHVILWIGDILYLYGWCGIIVYLCRKIKPKYLVLCVPIVGLIDFGVGVGVHQFFRMRRIEYVQAKAVEQTGIPLTESQQTAIEKWEELEKNFIPNREQAKENTQKMKSDYATVGGYIRPMALKGQTIFMPIEVWDSLALMFLGLALYQWGFLTGQWSNKSYKIVMAVGYGLGLPLAAYSFYHGVVYSPNLEAALLRLEQVAIPWTGLIYPFQRMLLVMAHVSLLTLLYKWNWLQGLFARLEAVGRMAFTNYIMHSVICTLFFFGYGLNYFAEFQYYQIYFVVLAIWILQLVVSPIWLRYFRFGPLEWLWRSLTYWKRQPMWR